MKVFTPRLEMIPCTLELIEADLHRRDELPKLLRAELGEGWPPVLLDVSAMQWVKNSLANDPTLGPWTMWYWIAREPRVLIGGSGFKSRPQDGTVEIGYGCLDKFQGRGFASEAVVAMVDWAFANGVQRVIAETLPELIASRRLLLKNGFRFIGEGSEQGVMRFERLRSA